MSFGAIIKDVAYVESEFSSFIQAKSSNFRIGCYTDIGNHAQRPYQLPHKVLLILET